MWGCSGISQRSLLDVPLWPLLVFCVSFINGVMTISNWHTNLRIISCAYGLTCWILLCVVKVEAPQPYVHPSPGWCILHLREASLLISRTQTDVPLSTATRNWHHKVGEIHCMDAFMRDLFYWKVFKLLSKTVEFWVGLPKCKIWNIWLFLSCHIILLCSWKLIVQLMTPDGTIIFNHVWTW